MCLRRAILSTARAVATLGAVIALAVIAMPTGADAAATVGTVLKVPAARTAPSAGGSPDFANCMTGNAQGDIAIAPGHTIGSNQALCPGSYELVLQTDGNLVVHGPSDARRRRQ
jgi:hypothetical protein